MAILKLLSLFAKLLSDLFEALKVRSGYCRLLYKYTQRLLTILRVCCFSLSFSTNNFPHPTVLCEIFGSWNHNTWIEPQFCRVILGCITYRIVHRHTTNNIRTAGHAKLLLLRCYIPMLSEVVVVEIVNSYPFLM